jgi:hypothetical protein
MTDARMLPPLNIKKLDVFDPVSGAPSSASAFTPEPAFHEQFSAKAARRPATREADPIATAQSQYHAY